jgi:hypothetical protein
MSSTYVKQCQAIVADYEKAGGAWPAKKSELVEWALSNKRWSPSREDIRRMCGEALVEAMRQEEFRDESGREVERAVIVPSASELLPPAAQSRSAVPPTNSAAETGRPSSRPSDLSARPPRSSPTVQ